MAEWKKVKLSEIIVEITETVGEKNLETLSISAGIGFVNQANKFGKELSGKQYSKYKVLYKGDFSYNKGNSKKYPQGCVYQLNNREIAAVPNVFESFRFIKGVNDFFEQLFISGFLNRQLFKKINHGVRDDGLLNLKSEDFYSCYVLFPPIEEQEKIAEILSTQDKLIELKQKLIDQKKQQKKWLMQNLLTGRIRLKGFDEEWEKYEFNNLFDTISSKKYQITTKEYQKRGKYPVIDQGKKLIIGYSDLIEKVLLCPDEGIILFGDHTREIKYITFDFIVGADGTQLLKTNNNFANTCFMYYYLSNLEIPNNGYSRHFKYIKSSIYKIPDLLEQTAIAEILSAQDKEIELLEKQLEQEKLKKKALMQLLLTGKVRVI